MKKLLLIAALFSFIFTSCSKDDETTMQDQLVGIWKLDLRLTQAPTGVMSDYLTFGKSSYTQSNENGQAVGSQGGYSIDFDYEAKQSVIVMGNEKYYIRIITQVVIEEDVTKDSEGNITNIEKKEAGKADVMSLSKVADPSTTFAYVKQ